MIGNTEKPRQARHYTSAEFFFMSKMNPTLAPEWLAKEGIQLNSGPVEIFIDGKRCYTATDIEDFGTIYDSPPSNEKI